MAVLGAPVFPHGNLAFFVAIFSEMTRLSAGASRKKNSCMSRKCRSKKKIDRAVDDGMSGAVWV